MKTKISTKRTNGMDMVVILLLGVMLFLTIALAAGLYSRVIAGQNSRDAARRQLATIVGRLHNADGTGRVSVQQTRYGTTLVIAEDTDSGVVETRYFVADGKLYEQTALQSDAVDASRATALSKTRVFRAAVDGAVVTLTTDAGTTHVTLRGGTGT